jgi:hypothetical protein
MRSDDGTLNLFSDGACGDDFPAAPGDQSRLTLGPSVDKTEQHSSRMATRKLSRKRWFIETAFEDIIVCERT